MSLLKINTIEDSTGSFNVSDIPDGTQYAFRNYIQNGGMEVWQRGTSFSNPAVYIYHADRWQLSAETASGTSNLSKASFNNPDYGSAIRYERTVAGTVGNYGLNSWYGMSHEIEDPFQFSGKTLTFSCVMKAEANKALFKPQILVNFGTGGSTRLIWYPDPVGVEITTDEVRYSLTFDMPDLSGYTFGTDRVSLQIFMALPLNDITLSHWYMGQVQLELGSKVTPFEKRPYVYELRLCQRFYCVLGTVRGARYHNASAMSECAFPVPMRKVPTTTYSAQGVIGSFVAEYTNAQTFSVYYSVDSSTGYLSCASVTASADF